MTRVHLVVLLAIAFGIAGAAAQQTTPYRAGVHTVSVYTTVADRAGEIVPNLTQDDFEVYDNGTRQDITLFANEEQPITVVIMLDRSGSMSSQFGLVRSAAEQFVMNLSKNDKARIGSFSNRIQIDPETFTSDRNELIRILHTNLLEAGATPLWNATAVAMTALARESGRRVVLVFTDGYDSPGKPGANVSAADLRERLKTEEVMLYAIGLADDCGPSALEPTAASAGAMLFQGQGRGRTPPRTPGRTLPIPGRGGDVGRGRGGIIRDPIGGGRFPIPPINRPTPGDPFGRPKAGSDSGGSSVPCVGVKPDPELKTLASEGGGGYFELTGAAHLSETFARVADELHTQYLIAFTAPVLDGKTHTIEVRLRRPDLIARARKSYVATPR